MPQLITDRRIQVAVGTGIVVVLILAMGSMGFASVVKSASDDASSFLRSSMSSKMFASDGSLIADLHGEIDREPVPLETIPSSLRLAVIAIEDRRFYRHGAIDVRGTIRALFNNLKGDRQGGSTITQQLAKNLYFHGQPRTVWRKGAEAVLAMGLERVSTKDQILEGYLNTAYFGRGAYGVQTAARSYFRKDVSDLTLAESAFLAGLIHMPARYDFTLSDAPDIQETRREAAIARRNVVLDAMVEVGSISRSESRRAKAQKLDLRQPKDPRWKHPYFVDAVLRELGVLRNRGDERPSDRFDFLGGTHSERAQAVYRSGLRIYTSMVPIVQKNSERAIEEQLPPTEKLSAALVSVEPGSGYVRALVGGRDYYPKGCDDPNSTKTSCRNAKVNLALGRAAGGSGRQPGSSFKPIVLAAALEKGLSLRQTLDGSPFTYRYGADEPWKVANYEGSAGGTMSVVDATAKSVNAAFARLEIQFLGKGDGPKGSKEVAEVARKLGIGFDTPEQLERSCGDEYNRNDACTPADNVPAIALGAKEVSPLEMAGAYAAFAHDGMYARPTFVEKITDADGKVLYTAEPDRSRAVSRDTARGVTYALRHVVERGTGRAASLGVRPVAGKTGTSQAWRDAWFDGYVPQLTTVTWVGNPQLVRDSSGRWTTESMTPSNGYPTRITGGSYPARIWHAAMEPTMAKARVLEFPDAPSSLFGPSVHLKPFKGEEKEAPAISDLASLIRLERSGARVVVHRQCPPGGGNGIRTWKTEKRGDTTHVYRSRAVC